MKITHRRVDLKAEEEARLLEIQRKRDAELTLLKEQEELKAVQLKAEEEKKKLRLHLLNIHLSQIEKLEFDYLEKFIHKYGLRTFFLFEDLFRDDVENVVSQGDIEETIFSIQDDLDTAKQEKLEAKTIEELKSKTVFIEEHETLLLSLKGLPKLRSILEKKGISLSYAQLIQLIIKKRDILFNEKVKPIKENLYCSIKQQVLNILEGRVHLGKRLDPSLIDDVIFVYTSVVKIFDRKIGDVTNNSDQLIVEYLNRLLIEISLIKDDLSVGELKSKITLYREQIDVLQFETYLINKEESDLDSRQMAVNIATLNGYEFESFLAEVFRNLGYLVLQTSLSGDQGADLIIEKDNERIAVQAKRYTKPVSNKAIQEVVAAVKHYNCSRAIVVSSSTFTQSAVQLASSNDVELWDSKKLDKVINMELAKISA